MDTSIDLKNHFCLKHKDFLQQTNKALEHLGLDSFCYTSIDLKTSERFILTDHPDWTRFAYKSNFYGSEVVKKIESTNLIQTFLWSDFAQNNDFNAVLKEAKNHGLRHGITLINYTEDRANMYYASTQRSLEDDRVLLNIQEHLRNFIPYFHCAAKELIAESTKHTFAVRKNQLIAGTELSLEDIKKFYEAIDLKQLVINEQGDTLTHQEALCVYLVITGKIAKQIAGFLAISVRTVEKHISNARRKLNIKINENLLGKLFDSIYFNHIMIYGKRYIDNLFA